MFTVKARGERPGFSETFPYPLRRTEGAHRLAYFDSGPGANGPPILFCHGLGGNFTHWEHVAPPLAETHRVIGLDLPGCGDSAKQKKNGAAHYTIRSYADAAVRLLDHLQIAEAVVVGHSLGGMVASEAALVHPRRVQQLVIIDAAGFHRYTRSLRWAARLIARPRLIAPTMERLAHTLLTNVFHERNRYTDRFVAQTRGREAHPTIDDFAEMACSILPDLVDRHFLDDLERIVQPTLVVWGDQDKLLPFAEVPAWARRLPKGQLVVLRGCGHMPITERPAAVVTALQEFLGVAAAPLRRTGSI